jgi:hypothetical protein
MRGPFYPDLSREAGMQVLYERCAAVDVGKDVIAVAVRVPGDGRGGDLAQVDVAFAESDTHDCRKFHQPRGARLLVASSRRIGGSRQLQQAAALESAQVGRSGVSPSRRIEHFCESPTMKARRMDRLSRSNRSICRGQ